MPPSFVIGPILIAVGGVVIIFRHRMSRANARAIRDRFGRISEDSARKSTPIHFLLLGIFLIGGGIFEVCRGIALIGGAPGP